MIRPTVLVLFLLLNNVLEAQLPAVLITDPVRLAAVKTRFAQHDQATMEMIAQLQQKADSFLSIAPMSVMEKAFLPESGDKHDYMSQAPYFWYDSSKPNGRPYLRRDGERNPEIYKITDRTYLGKLDEACRTLALAWYITGKQAYADKAAVLLTTWFLDDATRMHPNLNFGQAVPGVNSGRGIGIIETIALTGIADAVSLLQGAATWTSVKDHALKKWYADYLNWMLTSKNGKEEHAAKNNHGTWYFAQAIDFALFTGNMAKAKELVNESKSRLDSQLTKEGRQPLELERTNGLGYSSMNLHGWFTVATLASKTGIDLWHYQTSKGAGLQTAFDWLRPYAMGQQPWTYQQITPYHRNSEWYPLLLQASAGFGDQKYLHDAASIDNGHPPLSALLYAN